MTMVHRPTIGGSLCYNERSFRREALPEWVQLGLYWLIVSHTRQYCVNWLPLDSVTASNATVVDFCITREQEGLFSLIERHGFEMFQAYHTHSWKRFEVGIIRAMIAVYKERVE